MDSKDLKTCYNGEIPSKKASTIYKDKKLYFCDTPCLDLFNKDPERFLNSTHFRLEFEKLEDA